MLSGIINLPNNYDDMNERFSMIEKWEIAETLGWINPIDTIMDEAGVDSAEECIDDMEIYDDAELDAMDFIIDQVESGTTTVDMGSLQ